MSKTTRTDTLRLHVLASGSKGNAAIVERASTGRGILVDCGVCKRDVFSRAAQAGFDLGRLDAVLITHDHTDHTRGLGVVLRGLAREGVRPTVFADPFVVGASKDLREVASQGFKVEPLAADVQLELAGMRVTPFATSHDAAASFGFRFELGGGCGGDGGDGACVRALDAIGYVTDTGVLSPRAHELLSEVRILALEANHDLVMLQEGPYPYVVKRRIASDRGHLSNVQSAEVLARLAHPGLEHVIAMHISENNNMYSLAEDALRTALAGTSCNAQVTAARQRTLVSVS